ncbi:hypothetical protein B0J14DRAFT_580843 [Halenospora varia]|nr:hypothetical protein B0J14DRAFT_580843 [Halenospora varia]
MEQAWLDSLSEDWVSQPRSSGSPAPSLPSLTNSTSDSSNSRVPASRIPKYNPQKNTWTAEPGSNNSVLSERSPNHNNIPLSQRASRNPSKLRDEVSPNANGKDHSRSVSESTSRSVQYHTIQHKSLHASAKRGIHETPEWKKRLLNGDIEYGEQKDLFSPAGLENIFRPPPPQNSTRLHNRTFTDDTSIMPSSPPPYDIVRRPSSAMELRSDDQLEQVEHTSKHQPRGMKYKQMEESFSEFSTNDLSRSSSFQPRTSTIQEGQIVQSIEGTTPSAQSSVLQQKASLDAAGRVFSGQSDIRNEELSPIYISRHNTIDGVIDYGMDIQPAELQNRLEKYREDSPVQASEVQESSRIVLADRTADTDDFAHNGKFVNTRRGGRSREGSFQKRMLSPSSLPAIDESIMLPEESMQASTPKQLPNIRKTRVSIEKDDPQSPPRSPSPRTPHRSPGKSKGKQQETSSGSPLKLFGTYDTFTNQKLLRRLSQFEGDFDERENEELPPASIQERTQSELNDAFVSASSPRKGQHEEKDQKASSRKLNSFGAGDLDDFQFSEEVGHDSSDSVAYGDDDKENQSLPILDPSIQTRFKFQLEPSPALEDTGASTRRTRYTNTTSTTKRIVSIRRTIPPSNHSSQLSMDSPPSQKIDDLETPRKRYGDSEGKRMPKSPLKDPTPKRRRTLQKNDTLGIEADEQSLQLDSLRETHQHMQSIIGRKRKDARQGDDQQAANPKVLAMRQILRPRTPTPSQRSSQQHERHPLSELKLSSVEKARLLQEQKIAQIQAELDATDSPKLPLALGASQHLLDGSRKGSVTTQDFLDEAKKIMAGIRGNGRPRSGLTSVEESESENDRNVSGDGNADGEMFEDSYQESTQEPFSRPPSREGKPVSRPPVMQEDPELLNHLRKFQEMSDFDGIIASSIRSLAMAQEATNSAREIDRLTDETINRASNHQALGTFIESEPPNIRISENPDLQRKRKHSSSSSHQSVDADNQEAEFPSQGSTASSRSIPTGSSRGSDSRRVIAPHTVSHLIPEQLAGMVFDREQNRWVKRKSASAEHSGHNSLPSDETEEDPFGDIPDLSVDTTQELQQIKVTAQLKQAQLLEDHQISQPAKPFGESAAHDLATVAEETLEPALDPPNLLPANLPSHQSSKTNIQSGSEAEETSLPAHRHTNGTLNRRHNSKTKVYTEVAEEVEREISINEGRVNPSSPQRRRNVTITFSSPIASIIEPRTYADENESGNTANQGNDVDSDDGTDEGNSVIVSKREISRKSSSHKSHSMNRKSSRRTSLGRHSFPARPVSRIDEQDEDSLLPTSGSASRQRNISVVVSTPMVSKRISSMVLVTPGPPHEIGTLTLSPMSDFTMHQDDESLGLNVSYVAQNQRYAHGDDAQRTLSLAIKDLVEKITEVEPYEPFWEHIKQMDLKGKQLTNLHKLDEFCSQLEELDASNNQISQLNGIPASTRQLRITHNYLSDLTAWSHLGNLQYIDVSNNELESLSAFKYLVHLRGLRADNNRINSLDGIGQLDGLLNLRLRGNLIETLDFRNTRLQRLKELDLKNNVIRDVQNLSELFSLSDLNLEDNRISSFGMDRSEDMPSLKHLRLSGNDLEYIDVRPFPDLRLLYLDRNRLGTITNLLKTKYLDSLSLREQQDGAIIDMAFLSEAFEVRKLFLSGNLIKRFEPRAYFLNLQYLELANCGLESLPDHFGQLVPNTRVLNLNYNALRDIKALFGIVRLKKLHLAGNRLDSLRRSTTILAQFHSLHLLDLRANSLTLGFYPPVLETSMVLVKEGDDPVAQEPFTMAKADKTKDAKYCSRLDKGTKMLRRLYEILVLTGCGRLKSLDGLDVDKSILSSRDDVWDSLVEAGVFARQKDVPTANGTEVEEKSVADGNGDGVNEEPSAGQVERPQDLEPQPEPTPEEERWHAEDSFA